MRICVTSSQFHPHLFIVRRDEEREKREKREKRENYVAQGYDTNMRKHPSAGNREIRHHHGESLRLVITESPAHCITPRFLSEIGEMQAHGSGKATLWRFHKICSVSNV